MPVTSLKVQMLGDFSLETPTARIDNTGNRSRKIWLLLAYMIYYRNRPITPEEFITLLWGGEDESSANPTNALKTMFHRLRTLLDELDPRAGKDLILRREGSYAWNTAIPLELDVEEFDRLRGEGTGSVGEDEDVRLERDLKALELYHGSFLERLSGEAWVMPISAYYHGLYVQTLLEAVPLLEARGRWEDSSRLCQSAVIQEPYTEEIYRHLMTALIHQGKQRAAVQTYEDMSELLMTNFGVMPSEETRALYREAVKTVNDRTVSSGIILDQLRETAAPGGALVCDYDIFKIIYHSVARAVARSGDAVHLALLSVEGEDGKDLSRRSLDRVVENLQDLIRSNLRRGDVLSRCSVSQFIILLPQANFENSQMVCNRIIKAFNRQYPHSPAVLRASVHPLEPNP